ncbi:hypothetical protein [Elizabethkingia ursingii]|uniref:Uncharacterized protein n=1 Tax=Elizabethkingia ursingii TaxID=1756150 RepID=A0AAJ3NAX7_9FLAO|nr:hypothetical protein [Elizabethkingia ursingii]AQX07910.1 hypothetical protein BBD34_04290 [Elizabethkingia ursingii]OPB73738.1 hypothetical protein BAY32_11935 [Elizabethkingia ursingii]OPB88765.1 hypothetical protein BB021_05150 [Elizabethkingia ursingii]
MKANILIIALLTIFSCKAQQKNENSNIYNENITKLKKVIPNKVSYYGKPLYIFLQDLQDKNINIKEGYNADEWDNNKLRLYFIDWDSRNTLKDGEIASSVLITFDKSFDKNIVGSLIKENRAKWNNNMVSFFKDMIIKEIAFENVSGINTLGSKPK